MARIIVTNPIPESGLEALRGPGHDIVVGDADPSRGDVLAAIQGADAVVTLLTDKVDDEFLDAVGPQCRIVANVAVGFDNIDVAACERRGVVATNTPGVLTDATADTAFSLLLMATRRFAEGDRLIRSGQPWRWGMFMMLGSGIQGKTLGLVGAGKIGLAMARRAKAFGMNLIYSDAYEVRPEVAEELGLRRVEFDELLRTADVVSLHCPLLPSTHHLLSSEQFAMMKPTAYVINSARGPIIDEAALVRALRENQIAGAGLDVYEREPIIEAGLRDLENVVLLPHLGSATVETRTAMAELAARNVLAVLDGQAPETPVTH